MVISINDNKFSCVVVYTPNKIMEGMMGKTFDGFDGMLFIMAEDTIQSFWMKNCIVPIDMLFVIALLVYRTLVQVIKVRVGLFLNCQVGLVVQKR